MHYAIASFLSYTWSVTSINLHHFHFIHLLIRHIYRQRELNEMHAGICIGAWSLKSERGRCYDSWMRVLLGLLTLVVLPAPKIDFLHCTSGPYLAVWCLCYLSTGGSFSFFQCCFTHFIFTNRATRIESHSSTRSLKTKALHKLKQGSTEALKSIITAGWCIRLLVQGWKVHRSL